MTQRQHSQPQLQLPSREDEQLLQDIEYRIKTLLAEAEGAIAAKPFQNDHQEDEFVQNFEETFNQVKNSVSALLVLMLNWLNTRFMTLTVTLWNGLLVLTSLCTIIALLSNILLALTIILAFKSIGLILLLSVSYLAPGSNQLQLKSEMSEKKLYQAKTKKLI